MKDFNYHSAKDSKEASKLSSSNSAFLAGGMTTIPSMKLGLASYKDLIDIKNIKKLSGIKVSGKSVTIGATTKHVEVANSKEVKKAIPSLANFKAVSVWDCLNIFSEILFSSTKRFSNKPSLNFASNIFEQA